MMLSCDHRCVCKSETFRDLFKLKDVLHVRGIAEHLYFLINLAYCKDQGLLIPHIIFRTLLADSYKLSERIFCHDNSSIVIGVENRIVIFFRTGEESQNQ